jgi:hypothetical protein
MTPLEQFTAGYIVCLLWSSTDDEGEPLDSVCDHTDIAPETMERIKADCLKFYTENEEAIGGGCCNSHKECSDYEYAGHDFWLTRNGHGAGFWDGEWLEPHATTLDTASKAFGGCDPYIGDDGLIYL